MATRDLTLSLRIIAEAAAAVREIRGVTIESRDLGIQISRTANQAQNLVKLRDAAVTVGTALDAAKAQARDFGQQLVVAARAQDQLRDIRALRSLQNELREVSRITGAARTDLAELIEFEALAGRRSPRRTSVEGTVRRGGQLEESLRGQIAAVSGRLTGVDLGDLAGEEQRVAKLAAQLTALKVAQDAATASVRSGQRDQAALTAQIEALTAALKEAQVDTTRLTAEQAKLATMAEQASRAAEDQARKVVAAEAVRSARRQLGLSDPEAVTAQTDAAARSLQVLRSSANVSLGEVARGYANAATQARELARQQSSIPRLIGSGVFNSAQSFIGSAAAGAGIIGGGYGLVKTIQDIRDATIAFEGYRIALEAVTGSQQAAQRGLQFTSGLSNQLGLDLGKTTEQYTKFAAATRGTRLEGELGETVFRQLSETFAVLGLSSERQALSFQAVIQSLGKGVVQAEELRGQLAESLPGAVELAARAIGVTSERLNALIKTGQVNAVDFVIAFGAQAERELGERVPSSVASSRAAFGRFNNAITELKVAIGNSGLVDNLTTAFNTLAETVKDPAVVSGLSAIGSGIVATFGFLVKNAGVISQVLAAIYGASLGSKVGAVAGGLVGTLVAGPAGGIAGAQLGSLGGGLIAGGLAGGAVDNLFNDSGEQAAEAAPKVRDFRSELQKLGEQYAATAKAFQDAGTNPADAEAYLAPLRRQIDALNAEDPLKRSFNFSGDAQAEAQARILAATANAERTNQAEVDQQKLRARLEANSAVIAAQIEVANVRLNEALRTNLISTEQYLQRRGELNRQAIDAEVRQRSAELGGLSIQRAQVNSDTSEQGRQDRLKKIGDIDARAITIQGQINALKERERGIVLETANAIAKQRDEDAARLTELSGEIAALNRDRAGVASATLAKLQEQYSADLFGPDKARASLVGQLINTKVTQAEFDVVRQQADDLVSGLQQQFNTLSQAVQAGTVTTTQAQAEFASSLNRSNPALRNLLAQLQELAGSLTPEARAQVQQLSAAIEGLAISAQSPLDRLLASWRDTTAGLEQAGLSFLEGFADGLADVVTGGKLQFSSLLKSFAQDLARSGIRSLLAQLIGGSGGGGGGGGGLLGGLINAGISYALGGGGGYAKGVSSAGITFANGGAVVGPGTATSDSILARLSNGEYVLNAAAVRRVGVSFLDALNGGNLPSGRASTLPAFAAGGLVGNSFRSNRESGNGSGVVISQSFDFSGRDANDIVQLQAFGEKVKQQTINAVFDALRRGTAPV